VAVPTEAHAEVAISLLEAGIHVLVEKPMTRSIDDADRLHGRGEGGWPSLAFQAFDRETLLKGNLADMGAIAHVAGLPEARFDERLWEYADWDLFLALTQHRTPLELPAVALCYTSAGDDRLTGRHSNDYAIVREKWAIPPAAAEA